MKRILQNGRKISKTMSVMWLISKIHKELNNKKKNLFKNWQIKYKSTFLQRGCGNSQETDEKMLNITKHQGNVNQSKILPYICQNSLMKETRGAGEVMVKKESLHTVGGNVNWSNHYGVRVRLTSQKVPINKPQQPGEETPWEPTLLHTGTTT